MNAGAAALVASVHILFLYPLLNTGLANRPGELTLLFLLVGPITLLILALPATGAYLLYGVFARRPLPRRWLQWRYWGGFFIFHSLGTVAVFAHNAHFYRHLLDPSSLQRLVAASALILVSALSVTLAVVPRTLARRRSARIAALAVVGAGWLVLAALSVAERPSSEAAPTVELEPLASQQPLTIFGIDGLSSELLLPLMSEGRLPAFSRLVKEGSYGALRAFPPGDGMTLWTTVLTGKEPHRHGVRGLVRYKLLGADEEIALAPRGIGFSLVRALGLIHSVPTGPEDCVVKGFADILSAFHIPSTFLGFLRTVPAANHLPALLRSPKGSAAAEQTDGMAPWWPRLVAGSSPPDPLQDEVLAKGLAADLQLLQQATRLRSEENPPQVLAVRLAGFDYVLHRFLRFHSPADFGNVPAIALERYGQSVTEYCKFLDEWIGRELEVLHGRGHVLVISSHGMRAESIVARAIRHLRGAPPMSGSHHRGPAGIFFLVGPGVRAGHKVDGARLTDILPTLLYLQGLPVARDLDGEPLTEALSGSYLEATPVSSIPSYEGVSIGEQLHDGWPEPEEEFPLFD
ncbi:MAG: alkaline phosphatase family protein [Acidobacteriota bacterium]